MTDIVYDYISMGVDMITTAVLLSAVVILLRSSTVLSNYNANQQANSERINYYRQFNAYDCKDNLSTADVVNALIYYRNDLYMFVYRKDGTMEILSDSTKGQAINPADKSVYDYDTIKDKYTSSQKWSAVLYEDLLQYDTTTNTWLGTKSTSGYQGGVVVGIEFREM